MLATISALIMGTIVSISLLNFVAQIPISALKNDDQTDAIVVLTGGSSRLEEGVNLLMQRKAKKLFVSGVYRGVKFSGDSNERSKMRDGVYRGVKW